jgi:hypothetical protein
VGFRVVASAHKRNVYVTLNGYRNDDFTSYVYMLMILETQYSQNLPVSPVNVIVEDNVNENILYLEPITVCMFL